MLIPCFFGGAGEDCQEFGFCQKYSRGNYGKQYPATKGTWPSKRQNCLTGMGICKSNCCLKLEMYKSFQQSLSAPCFKVFPSAHNKAKTADASEVAGKH